MAITFGDPPANNGITYVILVQWLDMWSNTNCWSSTDPEGSGECYARVGWSWSTHSYNWLMVNL